MDSVIQAQGGKAVNLDLLQLFRRLNSGHRQVVREMVLALSRIEARR